MRNRNTQSCCKTTMMGKQLMRLSWCRERAISPYRPQPTERALRLTRRGRRQSSHWLHRFREAKPVKWKMPRLISQIRSKCWVLSCLRADCLVICGSDFVVRKQPWDYAVCFPKTLGKFLRIWAWLIRRDVVATFHWCMFPLSWMNYCWVHMRLLL